MATIGILGSKGGVGKTTIARALVVESIRSGLSARLCDLDPQGSAVDWCRLRVSLQVEPAVDVRGCASLAQALHGADELDYLVVDCPGRSSTVTLQLATVADLVVLPSGAGVDDLRPMVRLHQELVAGGVLSARIIVVLCRTATAGESRDARQYLAQAGVAVITGEIPERAGYRSAHGRGQAISEIGILTLRRVAEQVIHEIGEKLA
jgi:chromosome partitioning protein